MIHSYIDTMSNEYIEQNDLILLNVTNTKYIELVIYMFQNVSDKVVLHVNPDLT